MHDRKVVLGLGSSLDGYIARLNGNVDFLAMDPDHDWMAFFSRMDVWLMGRKSLDDAIKFGAGKSFASRGLRTIVFSRTLKQGDRKGVDITNDSPGKVIADLREKPGKDIWLGGGGELVRSFLEADLVDRIELGIVPALIGEGIRLFPAGFPERKFCTVETKSYPKTGLVALTYERMR